MYQLNLDSNNSPKAIKNLFNASSTIYTPKPATDETIDNNAQSAPRFFNDLDVNTKSGIIYFTDSSYLYHRSQNRQEVLDGSPRGRLFSYNIKSQTTTVLLCGLHFPNGVQFHDNNDQNSDLLVIESTRFRILNVNVNSLSKSNQFIESCHEDGSLSDILNTANNSFESPISIFLDSAPGFLDNIRIIPSSIKSDVKFLVGVGTKSTKPFSLLWFGYQSIVLRDLIGKLVPMKFIEKLVPPYGLVICVDKAGNIVDSWHDPSGTLSLVSEAQINPLTHDLWLGSHSNPFLAILKSNYFNL